MIIILVASTFYTCAHHAEEKVTLTNQIYMLKMLKIALIAVTLLDYEKLPSIPRENTTAVILPQLANWEGNFGMVMKGEAKDSYISLLNNLLI